MKSFGGEQQTQISTNNRVYSLALEHRSEVFIHDNAALSRYVTSFNKLMKTNRRCIPLNCMRKASKAANALLKVWLAEQLYKYSLWGKDYKQITLEEVTDVWNHSYRSGSRGKLKKAISGWSDFWLQFAAAQQSGILDCMHSLNGSEWILASHKITHKL